ncbi:MAG: hypothetical protein ACPGED_05410, partial [Flavobacteriales bacterium]
FLFLPNEALQFNNVGKKLQNEASTGRSTQKLESIGKPKEELVRSKNNAPHALHITVLSRKWRYC